MPIIISLLFALTAAAPAVPNEPFTAVCLRVVDGDTIIVRAAEGAEMRIRYAGIDTPEWDEPGGRRASALNRALVLGREVQLTPLAAQTDPYDRVLAHPAVCGIDVEEALLSAGLARRWRD